MIGPLAAKLRIAWRLTAFVVVTCALWGAMELDILLSRRTPHIELINKWVPRWAGTLLWIFGVRVDARGPLVVGGQLAPGRGADGIGRIYVMNHRSSFDIPVVLTHVAAHAISRHDLASWPLIGPGARRIGTLFVDRASRRSGAEVLKQVDEAIDRGEGVAMFPEGTAFGGDEVREFRPGAFKAALRAGSEIVPMGVAYENPDCYYRDESFLDHVRRAASLRCMRVALEVGEPIGPSGLSAIELRDIAHARVVDLVSRARARIDARRSPVLYPTLLGQEQGRSKAPQAEGGG
ncbi:MAG TPA: lysophospholipid acyltransferase family protein, partial [Lacipirellulaceae bacterium]|nr:lysophospholipid acyltransferase family protein [Lacipirellulaceae bacterium]